jgi:DNA modification methylase
MFMLYHDFDFRRLDDPDFKEDSVREALILPMLYRLGYRDAQIVRSKTLNHPFLKIGSKKRPVQLVPDYLFKVEDHFAWVLDAKSPNQPILQSDHLEQIYSYAIHPEVRTKFFALCNGRAFALFRLDQEKPILYFELDDIEAHWDELETFLAPAAFQQGKTYAYTTVKKALREPAFDYGNRPLLDEIPVKKQDAKRHFGVHGYFTKQSWNVVQEYIKQFSQKGDLVLDPFGGSGVTAVEAMMTDRRAIHLDLNPMSVFIVDSLVAPVDTMMMQAAFDRIKSAYEKNEPNTDAEIQAALKKYPYPKEAKLPKGSDVDFVEELFNSKQLAQLSLLKFSISKEKDKNVKKTFLLMFSGLLNKVNLTYHSSEGRSEGRGNSSVFAYYRYRIAKDPAFINVMDYFQSRFKKVLAAKKEIELKINAQTIDNLQVIKGTATNLDFLKKESVDYIYTDPPYGKKIPYLDLSVMWNAWLDLPVTAQDYQQEAIEGGEHLKSKADYNDLMAQSIREMYRVLKFDRWMSFVFAHKDPEFWHLIIETAEQCGFEYAGAVAQKNGQTSFKKRQNPFTVLSGQLIINFKKVKKPKYILKASLGMDIGEVVMQTVEGIIAQKNGATLEQINDELIIKGLELGFLDLLKKEYSDLTPILQESFDYDEKTELFTIRKNTPFKSHVDLNLRIRYYLISYLRRMDFQKKQVTFDEIVLYIIPLLRNGSTPSDQTVLNVLEDIADRMGDVHWQLKKPGQLTLNF